MKTIIQPDPVNEQEKHKNYYVNPFNVRGFLFPLKGNGRFCFFVQKHRNDPEKHGYQSSGLVRHIIRDFNNKHKSRSYHHWQSHLEQ